VRRVGVLTHFAADDPEGQHRLTAFEQGMRELGWAFGRNLQIDYRWAAGDPNRFRKYGIGPLAPDVNRRLPQTSTALLTRADEMIE
jgi:putative ABC transport system substrate-binding protein